MSAAEDDAVIAEMRGGALWLTLNRPEALNSVSVDVLDGLETALVQAERDLSVRALVITGAGRAFCAGADLKDAQDPSLMSAFFMRAGAVFDRLEALPKPTIAALNGITLAAGIEISLCCDLIFADPAARIGDGHATYGLIPGGGGSVRLPKRVGPGRAKHMMYTGDLYSAEAMERWGLVDIVAPEGRLEEAVASFVEQLTTKSPLGLARMKELVAFADQQSPAAALRNEIRISELHVHAYDRNEGIAAFTEKRTPRFEGR